MANAQKKFMIFVAITILTFLPGSVAQVQKRSVCGKVVLNTSDAVTKTEVILDYAGIELNPGAVTERDGTFCIENFVSDLSKPMPARLYVASFCRPNDVALVNIPFWRRLRRDPRFAGKRIMIGPGSRTTIGEIDVQIVYGHVSLRLLDERHQPLLTQASDWSPVWIRVRGRNGVTVHESGLSAVEIERSVDLKDSRIDLALPKGIWTIEVAPGGVPPDTGAKRTAVRWLRVPSKLRIDSCAKPLDIALSVPRTTRP